MFSIAVKIDVALMKSDVTSAIDLTDMETQFVGEHLHCSGSTLCFLPLQQSLEGWAQPSEHQDGASAASSRFVSHC